MRTVAALILVSTPLLAANPIREIENPKEIAAVFEKSSKVRVVNLWATWCVPCVAEMADLQAVADALAPSGLQLVGVSLDDAIPGGRETRKAKVTRFVEERGIRFPIVYYTGKTPALLDHYDTSGEIPITLVFGKDGRELARHEGIIERQSFEKEMRKLLAASKRP